ncbi:benzoate/H(+) symporter BenE family transporter [Alteromonas sp. C1M14]|uniref:benzoate/H(+) symporter BenE family transporter n=1 Tax=Alteromonas sp. C1M14 TaxID=2841567 RepID=UPI001C084BD9|nr:benzoate/H(+) symporter BenE family transporter [Alteromonas sp. C1M14]MBU2977628.1 benzoate/H(+) symporter BenE family transporter [Alteromonas sp. C1M14]
MTKKRNLSISHISAGFTAVLVGYSSAVILVIEAAKAAGATPDMVSSWLLVLGIGMGISCIGYSWHYKVPVVTAWSTPGAAFLIGTAGDFSLPEVIGAFIISSLLALLTARSRFITRQITRIPSSISSAMLAGILLPICLQVFTEGTTAPLLVAGFVALYVVGSALFPRYLMLMMLAVAVLVSLQLNSGQGSEIPVTWPALIWVTPTFSLSATISLAFPLFLITLLTQNLPGIAILKSYDYQPNVSQVLTGVSIINLVTAPFGGFAFNLAAITAAICMGEDAGDDRSHRFWAAIVAGGFYLIFGLSATVVVILFSHMNQTLVHVVAGLALFATFTASVQRSFANPAHRKAATITLLCSASGISIMQLGAPVWGLLLGLSVILLDQRNTLFLRYKKRA